MTSHLRTSTKETMLTDGICPIVDDFLGNDASIHGNIDAIGAIVRDKTQNGKFGGLGFLGKMREFVEVRT